MTTGRDSADGLDVVLDLESPADPVDDPLRPMGEVPEVLRPATVQTVVLIPLQTGR